MNSAFFEEGRGWAFMDEAVSALTGSSFKGRGQGECMPATRLCTNAPLTA